MEADFTAIIDQPRPKRRWFQYSLRSLFILTLLVAVAMSWLTVTIREHRRQYAATEAIRKMDGLVIVQAFPTWLGTLLRDDSLATVDRVWIEDNKVVDAGLEHLDGLQQLKHLQLPGTKVTGAGLAHIKGLTQLEQLDLSDTQASDAGLAHIEGLVKLEYLDLSRTNVTDAGLEHLKGLTKLQYLNLSDTRVTDAGLEHLKGLKRFQQSWGPGGCLVLERTGVTDAGVKELQKALPRCGILH